MIAKSMISLFLVLINFMDFAVLHPRKHYLYIGRAYNIFVRIFAMTRKRHKQTESSAPDAVATVSTRFPHNVP